MGLQGQGEEEGYGASVHVKVFFTDMRCPNPVQCCFWWILASGTYFYQQSNENSHL